MIGRRALLADAARLTLLAPFVGLDAAEAESQARFVLVILRGGLDGLAAVPPYGEGSYARLRGELALPSPGTRRGVLDLDGLFGLHPALAESHALYAAGELAVLHAVATPYRARSHFDAQKVLESGGNGPSASEGGWLNRALAALSTAGETRDAVALAGSVPLVLRGPFAVSAWTESRLPDADEDTLARIHALYEAREPELARRLTEALEARALVGDTDFAPDFSEPSEMAGERGDRPRFSRFVPVATAAARFLAEPAGPRVAVIEAGGWDTHAKQGADQGPLAIRLADLDAGLSTLKTELGSHWASTSVLVVTEFGRTVAANGTRGTDHGTAGCALLAGGAVRGGRVIADWPGIAGGDLYEGRDLRATLDLRAVFKGLLAEQFGIGAGALEREVFPGSTAIGPLTGLVA